MKISNIYQQRDSLTDFLPWLDYSDQHQCILLEDNISLGVCFKVRPIACEARPDVMLKAISQSIANSIKNTLPCEKDNPWILQVYVQKEHDLSDVYNQIKNYYSNQSSQLTATYLDNLREHLEYASKQNGIFQDSTVTNLNFRSGVLHVYGVLYQRKQTKNNNRQQRLEEIIRTARKLKDQLNAFGIGIQQMNGQDFYNWMTKWFNPKCQNNFIFPSAEQKPIGFDLAEQLFWSVPESFNQGWLFDGMPHKIMTIQNMTTRPAIGHLSAERKRGTDDKVFNLVDHLPEGSCFVVTIVLQSSSEVELHLKKIQSSAVGNHALAIKVKSELATAEQSIADSNPLFPVVMSLYLRGETLDDLHTKEAQGL